MSTFTYASEMPAPPAEVFAFHRDATNLAKITPPMPRFRLLADPGPSRVGARQVFRLSLGPLGLTWKARITRIDSKPDGRALVLEDVQECGPFRAWRHQHQVFAADAGGAVLRDVVHYRLFPTPAGPFLDWLLVRPGMAAMFAYRHQRTRQLLIRDRLARAEGD